ncbi:MAG: hypothetical protein AAF585_17315, partial [Verrucomicrobiota bacterium]
AFTTAAPLKYLAQFLHQVPRMLESVDPHRAKVFFESRPDAPRLDQKTERRLAIVINESVWRVGPSNKRRPSRHRDCLCDLDAARYEK